MFEQLGDASAVWGVLTSAQTTAGTMGKLVVDTGSGVGDNTALIATLL